MTAVRNVPLILFDTHAHSDAFELSQWKEVAARAFARGVKGNLSAGVWWDQFDRLLAEFSEFILMRGSNRDIVLRHFESSDRYCVLPALGLHPMEIAARWRTSDGKFDSIRAQADVDFFSERARRHRDVIWAVGETGFDVSSSVVEGWCKKDELLNAQNFAFEHSAQVAVELNRPLVIHSRSAWKKTQDAVDAALALGVRSFMVHCYGGPAADLPWIARRGGFASFGGVITWPDARRVRQAIVECPESVLLFETDSPDLAPILADGQRPKINEPQFICDVVKSAGELRQQSVRELAAINLDNFLRFLGF